MMPHLIPVSSFKYVLALALVTFLAVADPLPPFAGKSHGFNIVVSDASTAVREFGRQSGVRIMVSGELLKGKKLNPVTGEHSTDAALRILLADSGLMHRYVGERGVVLVPSDARDGARTGADSGQVMGVRLVEAQSVSAQSAASTDDAGEKPDEVVVSESRIDGLNNKGLLQSGRNAPLYHDVLTREDIERLGVTSLEELFRRIPQTSSPATSIQGAVNNSQVTGNAGITISTMGLRGFDSAQTVILVNGRSMPRTGEFDNSGVDLSRIPLSAIERVEILPYAGSAIYGSGAIGGAINIILRKEYSGKDLTVYTGTTTGGGASEYRVNYLDGRTFNQGRTSLTTTFSHQHREPLYAGDRDYLDRALERYGPSSGVLTATGRPAFEQYVLPALAGAPGTIVIGGSASPTADLGIPGAPGARYAMIPSGTSPADSFTLTPGSFSSTAGQFKNGERFGRSVLYEPIDSTSLNAQVEHEFIKDRLSVYGEFTLGHNRRSYSYPQQLVVNLAATDPLNPFRTDVTPGFVGRPVTLYLDAVDVPDSSSKYEYDSARAVIGFKGRLTERWEWSADGVYDYSHNDGVNIDTTTRIAALNGLTTQAAAPPPAQQPQTAAVRRAIYPILADHGAFPNAASDADRYLWALNTFETRGRQTEGNARLTGDLFDLPAGPLKASVVTKYQKWSFTTGGIRDSADEGSISLTGQIDIPTENVGTNSRSVWQNTVELSIPVIGKQWRPIPIESFEIQGSVSYESVDTVSNTDNGLFDPGSYTRHADSQVIAAKLQPVRDIAFRASYSDAFYPPAWNAVTQGEFRFELPGLFPDAARGNTIQAEPFDYAGGGNPNLRSEQAESQNYGIILTPRFLPGFTMSIDYWKIEKTDAATFADFFAAWSNPDFYSYALIRAEPTPAEAAMGWLGVVTEINVGPINAASVRTEGVDFRLSHVLETAAGTFLFNANASFTNNFLLQLSPAGDAVNQINAGGTAPLKWRGLGSMTWSRNRWVTSVTGRYVGPYSTPFTAPSAAFPSAFPLDGSRIPASMRWDLQVGYEIPVSSSSSSGSWSNLLSATKWTLGINNVLNDEPAFVTSFSPTGGGSSFYSTYDDPRQRFIYLSVRKGF